MLDFSTGGGVMLVGLGHLGGPLLDRLARSPRVNRIVACSRDAARGEARCNLARLSAMAAGRAAAIEFHPLDITRGDELADAVARAAPEIVVMAVSRRTWWLLDLFPEAAAAALRRAGFGAWLPWHLGPSLRLARALVAAGHRGAVVNAAYPDVVNPVLAAAVMTPTCGVGNVDEIAAKVQLLAAARLGAPPGELEITLVAHHALQPFVFSERLLRPAGDCPPYFLRVARHGRDVSEEVGAEELLGRPCPLPGGPAWGIFTAESAGRLIDALLAEERVRLHAPGPCGLPGGYPVRVGGLEVELDDIEGLSRERAISINAAAQGFDGIAAIEEDGTVAFTAATAAVMREELGFDHPRLRPGEAQAVADELDARFVEFARRHGVDLSKACV
jgi:hypothetical protein